MSEFGDALSVPQIAARQMVLEKDLQAVPGVIKAAAEEVVRCQRELNTAKAHAALELGDEYVRAKTVGDRDRLTWPLVKAQWEALQLAEIALDYCRNDFKSKDKELMSLSSRLKAALGADNAHARFGNG